MPEIFKIGAAVIFVPIALLISLTSVHMLQLSSYQTPSYWGWLRRSSRNYYSRYFFCALIAMLGLWESWIAWAAAAALSAGLWAILFIGRKPSKKPLKYTSRVIRLLTAQFILIALCAWLIYALPHRFALVWMASAYLMIPFITMLSNFITMPVQRMINRYYINGAKRILRESPNLKIIGITGSYGKTSMKFILTRLLSVKYETLMTPDSYNTTLGVVRTIRERLKPTHEVFVCEMGARHVGDIREICELVQPQQGILTSIGEQHLDTFKTTENVIKTKFELIESISGTAFLNLDSSPVREHARPKDCVTYALENPADYTADGLTVSSAGSTFTLNAPNGEKAVYTTSLLGRHAVLNIAGAAAAAHTMGIPLEKLTETIARLPQVPHRLQLVKGGQFTIIDDAFNANPAGVKAALETLAMFEGVKAVITPGMVELGARQDELNREYGRQIAEVCDYAVLVGGKQTAAIKEGLGGFENVTVADSFTEAMARVRELNPDVVLLANDLPDNY